MNLLEETLMSKLIYLIMQQNLRKGTKGTDTSELESNLAKLKAEIDRIDAYKLKPVPNDLRK